MEQNLQHLFLKKFLRKEAKGFSLIELVVVVAVLGVLSAIAIPSFNNIILKARQAGAASHVDALLKSVSIYKINTGSYPNNWNQISMYYAAPKICWLGPYIDGSIIVCVGGSCTSSAKTEEAHKIGGIMRRIGTTYAFRNDLMFTSNDIISEVLTQEITKSRPPKNADITLIPSDYPNNQASFTWNAKYLNKLSMQDKTWMLNLGKDSVNAAENIRSGLKGKVVIVNVF